MNRERQAWWLLVLLCGWLAACGPAAPQPSDYFGDISVGVGVASVTRAVNPSPDVKPGVCDNCGGTGKVGDGTVMVDCAACGGDGRIEEPAVTSVALPPCDAQNAVAQKQSQAEPQPEPPPKKERPTWIFFRQDDCAPCDRAQAMHADPRIKAWGKVFDVRVINLSREPAAMKTYGVHFTPTDYFVGTVCDGDSCQRVVCDFVGEPRSVNDYCWRFVGAYRELVDPNYGKAKR